MTLAEIKNSLKQQKADALLITRNNQFLGQDTRTEENLLYALTGFDGSAGMLLITAGQTVLFVDGRYEIQAQRQTASREIEVVCGKNAPIPQTVARWVKENFSFPCRIAYNSWCLSINDLHLFQSLLPRAVFIPCPQPTALSPARVFALPLKYSGQSSAEKLAQVANYLKQHNKTACFCAAADSVSWLFNLRSDALPESPILRAMAIITADGAYKLFGENLLFSENLPCVFLPFADLEKEFSALASQSWCTDFSHTPAEILRLMKTCGILPDNLPDAGQILKSVKNKTEIRGFKNAHVRDGAAVCRFLYWLEHNRKPLSEWQIVEKLKNFRQQEALFYSDSFATIAGSGANAAIVHYRPTAEENSLLLKNSVLLLDSGAQYYDGTTDITRTLAIGKPPREISRAYTIVLKAHIALATLTFPRNVPGIKMDAVCRSVLWRHHMDYAHGTGHGVGHFSNVHENPNNFSWYGSQQPLHPGTVMSIEPGFYKAGAFGIRIENLAYVVPIRGSDMLKFELLTLVPLDKRLIDKYLLSGEELAWINQYHRLVYQKISPRLNTQERQWLQKVCSPL